MSVALDDTAVGALATLVAGFDPGQLTDAAKAAVRRAILDLLGAAAAGAGTAAARAAREVAAGLHAAGPASVWFGGARLVPAGAAFANASAASALDLDDGHRAAGGHPGASVIPAALAVGQAVNASADELMAAIVLGYEVAVRVAAARDVAKLDTLSTGRWCGYGAAAVAAYLSRFDAATTAEALAIAGVVAPGLSAAGYSRRMGNSVKEGIPWAAAQGLAAAELAARGYTGPIDILDHPDYFDAATVRRGFDGWAVERIYFKPYACCRWIHAALDAVFAAREDAGGAVQEIDGIEVETFERALRLGNEVAPTTLEGAQYSVPFCVALGALAGPAALLPMRAGDLHRADVRALAARVRMRVAPDLDRRFPNQVPARVLVRAGNRIVEREVAIPLGDPDNPMSDAQLLEKFTALAPGAAGRIAGPILGLGTSHDAAELFDALESFL